MGLFSPLVGDLETNGISFVVVSAEHAADLKTLVDAELATKIAAQAGARLVGFEISGGGNGAYFECTICFLDAPGGELPGTGTALTNLSSHFFEAGRATETQAQLERFLTDNADQSVRALSTAAAGAGAVFMTGALLDSEATGTIKSFASGEATLVAGTLTVPVSLSDQTSDVWVQLIAPGGVTGVHFVVDTLVPGVPGSFDITAVDAAGALVATDTSTLRWFVLNADVD